MNQYRRGFAILSLAAFVGTQLYAAPVIGVATTRGTMQIDSAAVRGTANLSDGSSIRTNETAGQVQLQNGVQVTLGERSTAAVYSNHLELHEGSGQVAAKPGFDLDALGFRVSASGEKAVARISYQRPDRILVTAVNSGVKVSHNGVLLAKLNAGTTYFFEPGSAAGDDDKKPATKGGKTASNGSGTAGTAAKVGLSTAAKWGIVAGVAAAGAGVGLGVGLSGDDASR